MFSRMAPTVLFTAFCVAATGSYISKGVTPLTRPGTLDAGYIAALNAFSDEIALALQVGDHARFHALLEAQVSSADELSTSLGFEPDMLPAPYNKLRKILMRGTLQELREHLRATPQIALNKPLGRYGSVPIFWATAHNRHAKGMMDELIAAGADPAFTTAHGYTLAHAISSPFSYGMEDDLDAILDMLPETTLRARTDQNATPFHLALANSQGTLALALLEREAGDPNEHAPADLSIELQPGEPPLILAGSNVSLVEALLFAGADPLATDAQGGTIVDHVAAAAAEAELFLQERLKTSEGEAFDRRYAADYRKVRDMIRAAADGRLAKGG